MPLQLISTFPVGNSLLGQRYHVSLGVLRQQLSSGEISYQRQSSQSMGVLPVTSNLMKWFCVKNCKYTHRKDDRAENRAMRVKKKCRKKRNDSLEKKQTWEISNPLTSVAKPRQSLKRRQLSLWPVTQTAVEAFAQNPHPRISL